MIETTGLPTNVHWLRPVTIADLAEIESLPPATRAAVERYALSRGVTPPNVSSAGKTEYEKGWEDGCDAMQRELDSVYCPPPARKFSRGR